jgi:hypothetical protein
MNVLEALAFLGISDLSEVEARKSELLFDAKQFFTKQPIISQVFHNRITKLKHQYEALLIVTDEPERIKQLQVRVESQNGNEDEDEDGNENQKHNLIDQFNAFHAEKNMLYGSIYSAKSIVELIGYVGQLLQAYDSFIELWDCPLEADSNVIIGKEPDVMDVLNALKQLEELDIFTIGDLYLRIECCPVVLKNELLRMNALKKRNKNGGYFS